MDDLLTIQDDNLGGLRLLKFAPVWFFSSVSPLTFKAGYDWIKVECTSETMLLDEDPADDENGGYVNIAINGDLPKHRPDVNETLERYRFQQCIVQVVDQNGYTRLAGKGGGLVLSDPSSTGKQVTDPNEYRIQFKGKQLKKAEFI